MRGAVPGLPTPFPLAQRLPGVLQEDELATRFVGVFDETLAPIVLTLDCLDAYVDPWLAPSDFLDWLAGWVGLNLDDAWSVEQRRGLVSRAALVHRKRGTVEGVAAALRLTFDAEVEVSDSGGCAWSATPGGDLPGSDPATVHVRLVVERPDEIDVRRVDAVLESVKPAHVSHSYELLGSGDRKQEG